MWASELVSLPHGGVGWSVCVSSSWCCRLVSLYFSSQSFELIILCLVLKMLFFGKFVSRFISLPWVDVCWSVFVFSSRCCGSVRLCFFLTVLLVGQFVSLPHGAVGWSACVYCSECCGFFSIYVGSRNCGLVSLCLFVVILWAR